MERTYKSIKSVLKHHIDRLELGLYGLGRMITSQ